MELCAAEHRWEMVAEPPRRAAGGVLSPAMHEPADTRAVTELDRALGDGHGGSGCW